MVSQNKQCAECTVEEQKHECSILVAKSIMTAALLYLLYIGVTCPCRPALYSCHLTSMYAALTVVFAVLVYYNGLRVFSYDARKVK